MEPLRRLCRIDLGVLIVAKKAQTGKAAKAAAENEASRKAAGKGPNPSNVAGTDVVVVNKNALSTDVGPKVIALLDRAKADEDKALAALGEVRTKRYDAIAITTMAILKAAEADKSIDLSATFSGDTKKMNRLNDQLGIALGFREVETVIDGEKTFQKIVTAKAVRKYFPSAGEKKDTEEYKRKDTIRSNFITLVKRAAQAAEGMRTSKVHAKYEAGTLRIEGPKVKEVFGADSVLLNENASQLGDDKKLIAKPSFTAIRDIGAKAHDAAVHRGSNTRGVAAASAAPRVNPEEAFKSQCHMLISALGKISGPLAGVTREAASSLLNALTEKLKQTA